MDTLGVDCLGSLISLPILSLSFLYLLFFPSTSSRYLLLPYFLVFPDPLPIYS